MNTNQDTYGFSPDSLLTDREEVEARLHAILADRVMRFNPYRVADETLLECAGRAEFLPFPTLTQMVILHFVRVIPYSATNPREKIVFRIGADEREYRMPMSALDNKFTYRANRRQNWHLVNGKRITNSGMVEKMMGKSYFVSHLLLGDLNYGEKRPLYRMFRLKGDNATMASEIRAHMCESKIEMLEEVLKYPFSPDYLRCSRHFIDYTTPIRAFIETVRHFPDAKP